MANQSRFVTAALGLSILLGPGVITPGAAEPLFPASPDRAEPDAFAPDGGVPGPAAVPPRGALWVPLGEPDVTGTGSGARDEDLVAAVSRVGAKGMWQFMAGTARRYGLRVDRWVDERLDPEKSTIAAASYLSDLYRQFGSWALAQAAYNAGEVKVTRAIQKTGSRDF